MTHLGYDIGAPCALAHIRSSPPDGDFFMKTPSPSGATPEPNRPKSSLVRALPPSSGEAFVFRRLTDLAPSAAQGKACVVFDIDDNLADTRRRTFQIAQEFHQQTHLLPLDGLDARSPTFPRDPRVLASRQHLNAPQTEQFVDFWRERFFRGAYYAYDRPFEQMVDLAQQAHAQGFEVFYVTGRRRRTLPSTLKELSRFGLPNADTQHVCAKPLGASTLAHKIAAVKSLAERYDIGWHVTESRTETHGLQEALPAVPCVLLQDSREDSTVPVQPGTPVLPASFGVGTAGVGTA
jgi:hypothetical protein